MSTLWTNINVMRHIRASIISLIWNQISALTISLECMAARMSLRSRWVTFFSLSFSSQSPVWMWEPWSRGPLITRSTTTLCLREASPWTQPDLGWGMPGTKPNRVSHRLRLSPLVEGFTSSSMVNEIHSDQSSKGGMSTRCCGRSGRLGTWGLFFLLRLFSKSPKRPASPQQHVEWTKPRQGVVTHFWTFA